MLGMNFLLPNGNSQKGILCVRYYRQHGIKTLLIFSPLFLLTKTLANESDKTSIKTQQRNNYSQLKNETSCCVCHRLSLQRWHNTHPGASDMHQLIRSKTHQIAAPIPWDRELKCKTACIQDSRLGRAGA